MDLSVRHYERRIICVESLLRWFWNLLPPENIQKGENLQNSHKWLWRKVDQIVQKRVLWDIKLTISCQNYSQLSGHHFYDLADNIEDQNELQLIDSPFILVIDLPIYFWEYFYLVHFSPQVWQHQLKENQTQKCYWLICQKWVRVTV